MMTFNETHDPALRSWVPSANELASDFPIQNLPFGRFRLSPSESWRIGVAVGNQVLDLRAAGLIDHADMALLLAQSPSERSTLRLTLSREIGRASCRERV